MRFILVAFVAIAISSCGQATSSSPATRAPVTLAEGAEQCQPAPMAAPVELRSRAGYTEITATVTDANGAYVHSLGKDDFSVTVDGVSRKIEFFQPESSRPASVGILVDTSGSMQPKIPQARAAITQFIQDLNPHDDIFLVAFSSRPDVLQPFTTDQKRVVQRLDQLHASGQTALFDAIMLGMQTQEQNGCFEKKVLLVVTDGIDNSSEAKAPEVAAEARRSGVLVYSIGIGDPNAADTPMIAIGPRVIGGGGLERVDAKTLQSLSTETGSRTFIIRKIGDGDALRGACQTIADDLRSQYTLGFIAPASAEGASTGKLALQLRNKSGFTVRTREFVPLPAASTSPGASTPAA